MWRPTMLLLCLIAALSATPLRQAEAADDLARSLGELGRAAVIEAADGGVGDDAGVTVLKAGGDLRLLPPSALPLTPAATGTPGLLLLTSPLADPGGLRRASPAVGPPARRRAWLQCFRF